MQSKLLLMAVLLLAGCSSSYSEKQLLNTIGPAHKACMPYEGLRNLYAEEQLHDEPTIFKAYCADGTVIEGRVPYAE